MSDPLTIIPATSPDEFQAARALFQAYAKSVDLGYCLRNFKRELEELPKGYEPPQGAILLAWMELDGAPQAVGCVGIAPFQGAWEQNGTAEMRRLYVIPAQRGQGVGRALAEAAMTFSKQAGYTALRLETADTMVEAMALYAQLGFERQQPPTKFFPANIKILQRAV
ncbi:GNAT family N-acetyltransferase [Magnetofaba australis]|uniref:Putative N-acetyltransferase GCN5 n=1 Tax=Magnetofaba australis IT-1 TaxID=1434232 RepID=A0A1Y2JZ57_9PROT|nr:GNAT family N-acetyltransferase [Magnetofaba australis]OSM00185.1 putative N-acetyltransferase GCN5 [Magnetofaba australis IT-1]